MNVIRNILGERRFAKGYERSRYKNYTAEELSNMTDEDLMPKPISTEVKEKRVKELKGNKNPVVLSPKQYKRVQRLRKWDAEPIKDTTKMWEYINKGD